MTVSVTFSVTAKALPRYTGDALEDVMVRVFNSAGDTFVTYGTTDADGELVLELADSTTYWVRFFKVGYAFDSRLTIDVDSGASSNTFDIEGEDLDELTPSSISHLCRVSGYTRGADLAPRPGMTISFMTTGNPRVVHGQVVLVSEVIAKSNKEGYFEVELVQGMSYDVRAAGLDDMNIRVLVPEEQSAHLSDILFPYVAELSYASESLELEVGDEEEVALTVIMSSGAEIPFELDDGEWYHVNGFVTLESSDTEVATFEWDIEDGQPDKIVVTAVGAGTTTLVASLVENVEAPRTPTPTRNLASLSITVTE